MSTTRFRWQRASYTTIEFVDVSYDAAGNLEEATTEEGLMVAAYDADRLEIADKKTYTYDVYGLGNLDGRPPHRGGAGDLTYYGGNDDKLSANDDGTHANDPLNAYRHSGRRFDTDRHRTLICRWTR